MRDDRVYDYLGTPLAFIFFVITAPLGYTVIGFIRLRNWIRGKNG